MKPTMEQIAILGDTLTAIANEYDAKQRDKKCYNIHAKQQYYDAMQSILGWYETCGNLNYSVEMFTNDRFESFIKSKLKKAKLL